MSVAVSDKRAVSLSARHGAPGIALGWLCVAQIQGTAAIAEEYLRAALGASPPKLRSDSLCQCHGLAGVGEVYLEAYRVLREECWRDRGADIANVLVALCRKHSRQPWQHPPANPRPTLTDSCSVRPASCTSCYGITIRRL